MTPEFLILLMLGGIFLFYLAYTSKSILWWVAAIVVFTTACIGSFGIITVTPVVATATAVAGVTTYSYTTFTITESYVWLAALNLGAAGLCIVFLFADYFGWFNNAHDA